MLGQNGCLATCTYTLIKPKVLSINPVKKTHTQSNVLIKKIPEWEHLGIRSRCSFEMFKARERCNLTASKAAFKSRNVYGQWRAKQKILEFGLNKMMLLMFCATWTLKASEQELNPSLNFIHVNDHAPSVVEGDVTAHWTIQFCFSQYHPWKII